MALKFITPTRRLRPDAAASFERMKKAGMPTSRIESAHRSSAAQQKLYNLYLAGKGNFALPPDKSNHVKGIAMDVHGPAQAWLIKNGHEYGWRQDVNEKWHFDYSQNRDKALWRAKLRTVQKALGVRPTGVPDPTTTDAWARLTARAR